MIDIRTRRDIWPVLIAALCATASAAQTATLPYVLQGRVPAFGDALISAVGEWSPAQEPAAASDPELLQSAQTVSPAVTPRELARRYLNHALSSPEALSEACAFLEDRDEPGRKAEARLRALAPSSLAAAPAPAAAPRISPRTVGVAPSAGYLQKVNWDDESGSRLAFDGGVAQGEASAVYVPAPAPGQPVGLAKAEKPKGDAAAAGEEDNAVEAGGRASRPPSGEASADGAKDAGNKENAKGDAPVIRLVSVSIEKLQELAVNKDPDERKIQLEKWYGMGPGPLGGAGVFSSKVLKPEEVQADPVKKAVTEEAAQRGEAVDFLRTNSKVQLFTTAILPLEVPGYPGDINVGLRKGGVVEIVDTRPIPHGSTSDHLQRQAFVWPLTVDHLRNDMKTGEEITVTGRLEGSAGAAAGIGEGIDFPYYGGISAGAEAGVGGGADRWISLHINKIDADHVRISVQKGDGKTLTAHLSLTAGLDLGSDDFVPHVPPSTLEESAIGKAVVAGNDESAPGLFGKIQNLTQAEISAELWRSKHDLQSESWGAVSLSDPKTADALDQFFRVHPQALRSLPPAASFSQPLGAGRLNAEVREVTHERDLEAHLSVLHIDRSADTRYYEVRWRQDGGKTVRYLVVTAKSEFEENVDHTDRSQESVMWYDLDTGEQSISVQLGPQERLLTTTRERINDVIALQKALGLELETAKIDEPRPYLQFFGLGNYGRSRESGQFVLSNEGIQALKTAGRDALTIAYLRADWLFENESFPPGRNWAGERAAPPWASSSDAASLRPVVDFLRDNAMRSIQASGSNEGDDGLQSGYARLAPGRTLQGDARRYLAAEAYASYILKMQKAGNDPKHLLDLFARFRHDHAVELKRSVAATASLAGSRGEAGGAVPNVAGYLEMTGTRVTLKPKASPLELPDSPVDKVQDLLGRWQ